MKAIETKNLSKKFGELYAVKNVSLDIEKGKIFGLLGPNGAGKSTIMKMLSTLMLPTSGSIKVLGHDIKTSKQKIRSLISLVSDYTVLEDDLTPIENLEMFAEISNVKNYSKKVKDLIEDFGLGIYKGKLTKYLSSGNKQKLNIARALIKEPKILLLDEPTNAIDVETSRFIREYIIEENVKSEMTILISSHYIWEVEQLATEVGVIINGNIIIKEKTNDLINKFNSMFGIYELTFKKEKFENVLNNLKKQKDILTIKPITKEKIIIEVSNKDFNIKDMNLRKITPSLEDIYSYIVKNKKVK
ncbi:daunorubicin resistance protein DrrA family ABC transporter ATP-binding protein [Tepiditoga spiralis]|uniref:Daunorubicin resistance protein DrrA family ABC transporter ATP-binding protein n=1 Tax=Tepiditoga spiralis TaxID=2108365 RepID=A0A7G1GA17_9BACT|nr:ABC transporter ATP-binding protein [Tepiditoga spiralis]BBE32134.1 daunorubicin resistance protein DrrA family ABC transporter ATP-binding protein [Tepiditoga spiralis]